jgi:hypothetical protein
VFKQGQTCRVHAVKDWTVGVTQRALARHFGVSSAEELKLCLQNSTSPLDADLPLHLIEDELRGATLTLARQPGLVN